MDRVGRHKLGPVDQTVCPSYLDHLTLRGGAQLSTVSILTHKTEAVILNPVTSDSETQTGGTQVKGQRQDETKYHNVFREEVVAEGAVIKVDFIKGLFGQLHHVTLVVPAVLVFTDHLLAHHQLVHGGFISLSDQKHNCRSSCCNMR